MANTGTLRPQLTAAAGYGIVAWSFLIDILAALIKGADWLRDSSLFTHIAIAPAVKLDWGADLVTLWPTCLQLNPARTDEELGPSRRDIAERLGMFQHAHPTWRGTVPGSLESC